MTEGMRVLPSDTLFEERNAFLHLLLGLISVAERTLSTMVELAEASPPAAPPTATPQRRAPPPQGSILR